MGSMNKFIGIGNLGRDVELRYTKDGTPVATVNLAMNETWTGKDGEKHEKTEWLRCVIWSKAAEALAPYLLKGKQIAVEGKIQTRKFEDKDGNDKYTTECRVDRVVLLGGGDGGKRRSRDEVDDAEPYTTAPVAAPDLDESDIPFVWLFPYLIPLAATTLGVVVTC